MTSVCPKLCVHSKYLRTCILGQPVVYSVHTCTHQKESIMDLTKRFTVKTTESFHKAVRVRAAELGQPISDIVRDLLKMWLEGKIQLPDKDERKE